MKFIAGLGNFGDKYAYTYHNLGFLAVERLADILDIEFTKTQCRALTGSGWYKGEKVILIKPLTFMNLSGVAIRELLSFYKASVTDLLVFSDDIDLPEGEIRFRERGSGGTHNGLRNIVSELNSTDFARVRIGMGKPPLHMALVDYVLSDIPNEKRQLFYDAFCNAAERAKQWLDEKIDIRK